MSLHLESPRQADTRREDPHYAFACKVIDWQEYLVYRPFYPSSMWEAWLRYHESHGGGFRAAHDIGAGPGVAALELSKHFSHVFVSDAGELNIAEAKQNLQPSERFTCSQVPAEVSWLGDASVDFACICMALHFMDPDIAIRNAAKAIRPGGTLAICTYSFKLNFPGCRKLQRLWLDVMTVAVRSFMVGEYCIPRAVEGLRRVMIGLDYASIPEELFGHVQRWQISVENEKKPFCFFDDDEFKHAKSNVQAHEQVQQIIDHSWRREVDVDWLRGILASSNLGLTEEQCEMPSWRELQRVIDEEMAGKVIIEWPVAMIMATRKRD
ncbi:hypothetical protein HIM_04962 [Hirsutella minnesotensis 3608]|uniref:Methyltransferase type 11 domain-containing protein n=1 Tax=Hirsutella minnesotensis 3608 TaxID=1043627 RepID=A0A0F7ZPN4_9HYPO|nr:hypothetical protein HIM_04962 [Hirsutella minnesotensis 3608]